MVEPTPRDWIKSRSAATQRFVLTGIVGFLVASVVVVVQFSSWAAMGWGSANFLPTWMLGLIYVVAGYVGLAVFYYAFGFSATVERRLKWASAGLAGVLAMMWVASALAHSVPQLSTLLVSTPVERDLVIYSSKHGVTSGRSHRGNYCRTHIRFGPLYEFRGGWCRIYMGANETWTFRGEGNAFAMRIDEWVR